MLVDATAHILYHKKRLYYLKSEIRDSGPSYPILEDIVIEVPSHSVRATLKNRV